MKKIILLFLIGLCLNGYGQRKNYYYDDYKTVKKHTLQLVVGPTIFHGDADQWKPRIFGGLLYRYSVSPAYGFNIAGNIGQLSGARNKKGFGYFYNSWDTKPEPENYKFVNNYWAVELTAHLILTNLSYVKKQRHWHFYALAGSGLMHSNAKGTLSGDKKKWFNNTQTDTNYTFKGYNATIPIGFGVAWYINKSFDFGMEYKYTSTQKDLLDAYSADIWRNRTFDSYSTLGFTLSYKFGNKNNDKHMDWLSPTNDLIEFMKQKDTDTDKDGVPDNFDAEPDTPEGARVYGNGVSVDSDKDKVPDYKDKEVLSVCDKVDENGVALDTDVDGVPDCNDEEPNTPAGSLVDVKGRKLDIKPESGGMCCDCSNDIVLPSVFLDEDNEFTPAAFGAVYIIGTKMLQCPDVSVELTSYYGKNKSSEQGARTKATVLIEYLTKNFGIPASKFKVQTKPESEGGKNSKQRVDVQTRKL